MPNVPFYHYLWEEGSQYALKLKQEVGNLRFKKLILLLPDDTLEVDKKVIEQAFMMFCSAKKVTSILQCCLLSKQHNRYVAIARTARCLIISYVKYNKRIAARFLDKETVDIQKIRSEIRNLHNDCEFNDLPIYINNLNEDMNTFSELGQMVSFTEYPRGLEAYW
jgi:hypothetical protein